MGSSSLHQFSFSSLGGVKLKTPLKKRPSSSLQIHAFSYKSFVSFAIEETQRHIQLVPFPFQVKGTSSDQIHDARGQTSPMFEFVVQKKGLHQFCFTNKSPSHETVDFDVHVRYFTYFDRHAKDEHFNPLLEHISRLEEALYNIQFDQHWLEPQTDRQAIVNEGMSSRAMFESATLIAASILQVSSCAAFLKESLAHLEFRVVIASDDVHLLAIDPSFPLPIVVAPRENITDCGTQLIVVIESNEFNVYTRQCKVNENK